MKKIGILLLFISIMATSCNKWLDVMPKTNIDENELFSSENGFKEALTGVYLQISRKGMYGQRLSYDYLDNLAQFYNPRISEKTYEFLPQNGTNSEIWQDAYKAIADINNLLQWLEKNPGVITTEGLKDIIQGEALGLRGFIYFDLLRLFGPIYSKDASSPTLPYRTQLSKKAEPLLPASKVAELIFADLKKAESLLKQDPLDFRYPISMSFKDQSNFLSFRMKRMNLFAVKALMARAYLYVGDKENAKKYALEVVNATKTGENTLFKLATSNTSDYILSSELIFAINVFKFKDTVTEAFTLPRGSFVVKSTQRIDELFNTHVDGRNDFRVAEGKGFDYSSAGAVTKKYTQERLFSICVSESIPLIRLAEMYLILAECSDEMRTSADWLSQLRTARGTTPIASFKNQEEKMNAIEIEYRKDFYAEGQYWYFLKRNFRKRFVGYSLKQDMTEANYRFALPLSEINALD